MLAWRLQLRRATREEEPKAQPATLLGTPCFTEKLQVKLRNVVLVPIGGGSSGRRLQGSLVIGNTHRDKGEGSQALSEEDAAIAAALGERL